jgi:hypothetical protein
VTNWRGIDLPRPVTLADRIRSTPLSE